MTPRAWLEQYEGKEPRLVGGIMSGTSADGVDAAVVAIWGTGRRLRAEPVAYATTPFSHDLRERILAAASGRANADAIAVLSRALSDAYAETLSLACAEGDCRLDAIGCHGQTIAHRPDGWEGLPPATLQIGAPAVLAHRFGVPVVSDFRMADVALGGQGAPLVPYVDACLFVHTDRSRCLQNLGGVGNVTYLPAAGSPVDALGFDTGPGNLLLDRAAQWATNGALTIDRDGALALTGAVDPGALDWLRALPLLHRAPPRSFGREEFGEALFQALLARRRWSGPDLLATLTEWTAETIADAYRAFLPTLPDEVFVSGGGARNPAVVAALTRRLHPIPVLPASALGIDADAKEAIAFAVLANETLLGTPASLPQVTGARRAALLGSITFP